jgi:hypothetical protein
MCVCRVLAMAPAFAQCWRGVSHKVLAMCVCSHFWQIDMQKTFVAETLDQSGCTLRDRCLNLVVKRLYLV